MSLASRFVSLVGATALAASALCATPEAAAQAALDTSLGGPIGFGPGTNCLSPNDDGSSNTIPITAAFSSGLTFFTGHYNSMFVNTNGNITFNAAVPQYTPSAFPVAAQPMIAPYWADVDIRPPGSSIGAGTSPGYLGCSSPRDNAVYWSVAPGRIVVTWYNVGYYSEHTDKRMSFQLILTPAAAVCDPMGGVGNFDVEFRYSRCEWETGDASGGSGGLGGTPAQAGFDAGNSRDFVEIMGSRMPGIRTHLCTSTNVPAVPGVATPGIWRFAVRGGQVMCPDAGMVCTVAGAHGACADGRTACTGSTTTCQQVVQPAAEVCDGLDNDCNGTADDGAMCDVGEMCLHGVCTGACLEGSCNDGYTCVTGQCIETACVGHTCPDGQRCAGGACVGACDGITCPLGQVCRTGGCVDPCGSVTCMSGQVCEGGICLAPCGMCRPCGTGQSCGGDGRCVESACASVTCTGGQGCRAGTCVDPCDGAVCPGGQLCQGGTCVMAPPDAGPPPDDAAIPTSDSGPVTTTDGGNTTGDAGRTDARADARATDGGTRIPTDTGCGCHAPGNSGQGSQRTGALALTALLGLALRRRKQRHSA